MDNRDGECFHQSQENGGIVLDLQYFINEHPEWGPYVGLLLVSLLAWFLFFLCRAVLSRLLLSLSRHISNAWMQTLFDKRLLSRASWVLPVVAFHVALSSLPNLPPVLVLILQKVAVSTLIVLTLRVITLWLSKINDVYSTLEISRNRPIKGFIQIINLLLYSAAFILIISTLLDRSPWVFLSGLGAMTAILLLVFRDTLLSMVAGLQLISNDLIRVGDWIEIESFGADGDVVDIALHTVRVQNWDRTITVIPTHKFLEHSFKNWRGMQESGGRRIKRSVFIDVTSIRFLADQEIDRFGRLLLLRDYISRKKAELSEHNKKYDQTDLIANTRRLTNVGTFRAYLIEYLKQNPRIHQKMTLMVRQLAPEAQGLPIEIYCFTNTTAWTEYEAIQADLFDHILAIAGEFGLRIFQNPTGNDFRLFTGPALVHENNEESLV